VRSVEGSVGSVLRRSPLLSSLFLGTSVLANLWSSAALFSHNGFFLMAACGVPIVSGVLFGSWRLFWLHGSVAVIVTSLIWNTPRIWHPLFGVPAPSEGAGGALLAWAVFLAFFALGIVIRSVVTRGYPSCERRGDRQKTSRGTLRFVTSHGHYESTSMGTLSIAFLPRCPDLQLTSGSRRKRYRTCAW